MNDLYLIAIVLGIAAAYFLFGGQLLLGSAGLKTAKDTFIINNINTTGSATDYTNVAFLNKSQSFTLINNFTNFTVANLLNVSGILFVGENRSSFPIACAGNNFLSALGSNGIFTCTADTDNAVDFTNVAFQNNSQNWTANQNFTQSVWIGKNLNVTGNSTLGNASIEYLNVSGQLFVGANRSSFPITCSGNQFLSSLGSNGIFICSTPVIYNATYELMYNASYLTSDVDTTDYTNIAFQNNTQNFTAQNTFRDLIILGWFNVTNQTVYTTLNNVTSLGYINATGFNATKSSIFSNINVSGFINVTSWISAGLINATSFNATGASIFGNVNVSGYVNATSFGVFQYVNASSFNVSNTETSYYDNSTYQNATKNVTGTSIGVMQINQTTAGYYPAVVLLFDNETEVSGTTVQWLNFTLPAANGFSRIIATTEYTLLGTSATAYSWVLEIAVGGTIIHDTNVTASAITSDIFRSSSVMEAGTTTTTGKLTVKLYPITAGGATVELQDLIVYGVV